jgi:hypothetical protein
MESETASSADEQVSGGGGGGGGGGASAGADTRGKHRILAELKARGARNEVFGGQFETFFFVLDILNATDSLHY